MQAQSPSNTNMATVFESSFLSNRLHRIEERYEEPANTFGKCDCTSYSYLALSVVFFTIGTVITIFSLGDVADGHVLSNLGEMWFIGPIFICSGLTLAVKCMLYLRKKSVVRQMIFHRRQLFREFAGTRGMGSIGTAVTLGPPSYEVIVQESSNELPPPSYAEAIALLHRTIENDAKSSSAAVSCGSIAAAENIRRKP
ncbi:uncharacterized protein LOC143375304 isoform X2 [Andrena cerasifolii]|uniref:uncharacterized protein LOC143375304 isoform X2 n=1 Tax=Andrena cerasifolii TaxID=2819439 RepID=UPI0040381749